MFNHAGSRMQRSGNRQYPLNYESRQGASTVEKKTSAIRLRFLWKRMPSTGNACYRKLPALALKSTHRAQRDTGDKAPEVDPAANIGRRQEFSSLPSSPEPRTDRPRFARQHLAQ